MQFKTKAIVAACAFLIGSAAYAAELDGAALFKAKMCFTCHGADGNSPTAPMYPKLTGQKEDYMISQMLAIREGKRTNGAAAAMKALTASVSDDEFKAIAHWLTQQTAMTGGGVDLEAVGAKLFTEKACNTCHGNDANSPVASEENGNPPLLAGQGKTYSINQMKDIRDGKRTSNDSAKMQAKVKEVSDDDFTAIAAWLESVKPATK